MDIATLGSVVGMTTGSLSLVFQGVSTFKRSNLERLAAMLIESQQDLHRIGERPELQRYFLSILDRAAQEADEEKLNAWKNATVSIATDFSEFPYKDVFLKAVESLTVFDLVVLHRLYSCHKAKKHEENYSYSNTIKYDVYDYMAKNGADENMISLSFQRLHSFGLVDAASTFGTLSLGRPNEIGEHFLEFITE